MTAAVSAPMRQRIVAAAVQMTTESGWAQVTMARLADRVGVSRQTVYNEIGSKPALAEAMILAELDRFLSVVNEAFDRHPADLVEAIRDASAAVLELARGNRLLHAVVSATHGADTELLPLLTTHAESLLAAAKSVVRERVAPYTVGPGAGPDTGLGVGLDEGHLDAAIDMVVRVVLSHVMQPSGSPGQTAADLAWIAERVLRG